MNEDLQDGLKGMGTGILLGLPFQIIIGMPWYWILGTVVLNVIISSLFLYFVVKQITSIRGFEDNNKEVKHGRQTRTR